ncbi:hypothetical protein BpHYR1_027538 [Brachionus plicatilis]|uniref:Uncharacterized protein n=1 Tax=Brachionus plicatilis TaxID=10195 RepID=A0A3M7SNR9_BRAPC|nr:hypothetical protein BpHYR1_027538 [Brachionus plicatilis]
MVVTRDMVYYNGFYRELGRGANKLVINKSKGNKIIEILSVLSNDVISDLILVVQPQYPFYRGDKTFNTYLFDNPTKRKNFAIDEIFFLHKLNKFYVSVEKKHSVWNRLNNEITIINLGINS